MPPTSLQQGPTRPGKKGSLPAGARLKLGRLARLWGELTLGGILLITLLAVWHLRRRADLVRSRLGQPRALPDLDPGPTEPRSAEP